ncbi:MAG: hypothetical protein AAFY99_14525 [Pseudomonadota bacterium]
MSRKPDVTRWSLQYLGLTAVICAVLILLLGQLGTIFAQATERDQLYRYFEEALSPIRSGVSVVKWRPAKVPLDRVFGPAEENLIGMAMTSAWATHAAALETGSPLGLSDYFSGIGLERAERSLAMPGVRMAVLGQIARPVYFHADGSLVQVKTEALVSRFRVTENGDFEALSVTRDSMLTTLRNDVLGWRIISHERDGVEALSTPAPAVEIEPAAGINYYPSKTPWSRFWSEFDPHVVAEDFTRVADLGANTVRIFLQREDFLERDRASKALADLKTLLALAGDAEIKVVPTLFDMRGGYETVKWANDMAYLEGVLPVLAASEHVAYVDLKNEPDLDMENQGQGQVEAWARTMLAASRALAPELAYTIGWSAPSAAHIMADTLDLITYHDYGPIEESAASLAAVREAAGQRQVHVTELGETSFSLFVGRFPSSPDAQAERLSARLTALANADGLFVWTLNDFPDPDHTAVGRSPWVIALQSRFGLYSQSGAPKPAAAAVARAYKDFLTSFKGDLL